MSISKEINQPPSIPAAVDILTLPGLAYPHAGYLPLLDGHPGSVLRKLNWEGFIKELTIPPYFSAVRYVYTQAVKVVM
jgi:hypothetical protein